MDGTDGMDRLKDVCIGMNVSNIEGTIKRKYVQATSRWSCSMLQRTS
jgi:hypothetical protein